MENINSLVKQLQEIGLTQAEIARQVGVSQPTISDMSRGKAGFRPSYKVMSGLINLAKKHGLKVGFLE